MSNQVVDPIDVKCPYCSAAKGKPCITTYGSNVGLPTLTHTHRKTAAADASKLAAVLPEHGKVIETTVERDEKLDKLPYVKFDKFAKPKLSKKLRYHVRNRDYVWCDVHGAIHGSANQSYNEPCDAPDWRRVYVESDDRKETF